MNKNPLIQKTEDGGVTLYREDIRETYHSRKGAFAESWYVYIQQGLERCKVQNPKVLEVGWGTGYNTFLALQWAHQKKSTLNYVALESDPLPYEFACSYIDHFNLDEAEASAWKQLHALEWNKFHKIEKGISLEKIHRRIQDYRITAESIDVIFFDAFAPSKQPDIWQSEVLKKCLDGLKKEGLITTYCAQGQFKRNLTSLGFKVERVKGPPGKMEMTVAYK